MVNSMLYIFHHNTTTQLYSTGLDYLKAGPSGALHSLVV